MSTCVQDALRRKWRELKDVVLSGRGGRGARLAFSLLRPLILRCKTFLPGDDLPSLALYLMYHREMGVLPCDGWRMQQPPRIAQEELEALRLRYARDQAAVARRLALDDIDLSVAVPFRGPRRIAVHVHDFHHDVLPQIEDALKNIPLPFDLFVSTPEPNRGRDIAPLICRFGRKLLEYDYVAHFHTKKSAHVTERGDWMGHILGQLLGSPEDVARIFGLLESGYGFVSPSDFLDMPEDPTGWMHNLPFAEELVRRSGLDVDLRRDFTPMAFPQGSMFWARGDFLRHFLTLPLEFEDFPEEPIGVDGSPAHALERLFFLWGQGTGLRVARLSDGRGK